MNNGLYGIIIFQIKYIGTKTAINYYLLTNVYNLQIILLFNFIILVAF